MRWWLPLGVSAVIGGALLAWSAAGHGSRGPWASLGPGLEMRSFTAVEHGVAIPVVALRTMPDRLRAIGGTPRSASQWRLAAAARAATNGGYFDEKSKSLGLRISSGRKFSPVHGTRWPIFAVSRSGGARIVPAASAARLSKNIRSILFAVQCGPQLVRDGHPCVVKQQWARRTGLGITRQGKVILAVADGDISLPGWARLWQSATGLNCVEALNLDGGSSTQLALRAGSRQLEVSGGRGVPDAIIIR